MENEKGKENKRAFACWPVRCLANSATEDFCLDSRRRPASIYLFIGRMKNDGLVKKKKRPQVRGPKSNGYKAASVEIAVFL